MLINYNQIYPGFAYSLYMYIFCNCNYCSNAFMHVFACIQSTIVSLRVFNQQEKGYVVDAQNTASIPMRERRPNIVWYIRQSSCSGFLMLLIA